MLNELLEDLKNHIEKFNNIYISQKITSVEAIKLKMPNEADKKINKELGLDENLILKVEFFLKHKLLQWRLKKNPNNDNERSFYIVIDGIDLADDEYKEEYFKDTYDAIKYLKNEIMKTYEKFQNL